MAMADISVSRREVVAACARAGSFTILPARLLGRGRAVRPSDRMNIGFIGIGSYGQRGLNELSTQNIVAVCDVDWRPRAQVGSKGPIASEVVQRYPGAKRFDDWRVMLEQMDKSIDAVVVCTSDHTHAVASITAMKLGKHVYCEKPLAHSIQEVRAMMAAERKYKVSTQMGVQGHASEDCRSMVEWIRDGAIGTVTEIHLFEGAHREGMSIPSSYYDDLRHVQDDIPLPPEVKWDLWLGPAPYRSFNPMYLPLFWRKWVDFGTGLLGDHGSHYLDPVYWALDLGWPETIEAETDPQYDPERNSQTYPAMATVRYRFPARAKRRAVDLTWHANNMPSLPKGWRQDENLPVGGAIITGTNGSIVHGPIYNSQPGVPLPGQVRLVPEALDKEYKRPAKTLPRPRSHWLEWVECARERKPASAHFGYAGIITQIALLGDIAIRHKGQRLRFDAKHERFTNSETANHMFQAQPRQGWSLPA